MCACDAQFAQSNTAICAMIVIGFLNVYIISKVITSQCKQDQNQL